MKQYPVFYTFLVMNKVKSVLFFSYFTGTGPVPVKELMCNMTKTTRATVHKVRIVCIVLRQKSIMWRKHTELITWLHIEGILPKWPHLPCVSMAGKALLTGYPRYHVIYFPMTALYDLSYNHTIFKRGISLEIASWNAGWPQRYVKWACWP